MDLYATQTNTFKNNLNLEKFGFSLFVTPDSRKKVGLPIWVSTGTTAPFAIDCGAWGCFQKGTPFDWVNFTKLVKELGTAAAFIIAPDIVRGGYPSLALSMHWANNQTLTDSLILIAVQDGMTPSIVGPLLGTNMGIAIGGTDLWKERTAADWRKASRYCHMLRVNSYRRLRIAYESGMDSVDGTSATVYSKNARKIFSWNDSIHRQKIMFRRS